MNSFPFPVIINRVDDAGLNVGTNQGIREAVLRGVARNVSVLAVGPGVEDAAKRLRDLDVCFGFHGCLTSEWVAPCWGPLTGVDQLRDQRGMFPASCDELKALNPSEGVVIDEMAAQLAHLRALGFRFSYMDEHMYFSYALPALQPALREFARREGLIYRMEIPCLPNVPEEHGKADSPERFLKRLGAAKPGVWLEINHPVVDSPDMHGVHLQGQAPGVVVVERVEQLRVFTDLRVKAFFEAGNVRSVRYDELENAL